MAILHCVACRHQWEGGADGNCARCGETRYIIEAEDDLEAGMRRRSGLLPGFYRQAICRWKRPGAGDE